MSSFFSSATSSSFLLSTFRASTRATAAPSSAFPLHTARIGMARTITTLSSSFLTSRSSTLSFLSSPNAASAAAASTSFLTHSPSSPSSSYSPSLSTSFTSTFNNLSSSLRSPLFWTPMRFATKKAGGSSKNKQDSVGRHLGLKRAGDQPVQTGEILVRQRGTSVHPGLGVGMGRDHTLFAMRPGRVAFGYVLRERRTRRRLRQYVNVIDETMTQEQLDAYYAQKQNEYMEVIRCKARGERVPTARSLYLRDFYAKERSRVREADATLLQQNAKPATA